MIEKLRIRMYRMGFGDCFLLTFGSTDGSSGHILIDCGSITEGGAQVSKVAKDVIEACGPQGAAPRLELVVATHRHRDHVGGFADPAWSAVEVGEVWMPWTEDPLDADATRLRNRQSGFALALTRATAITGLSQDDDPLAPTAGPKAKAKDAEIAVHAVALNALTNEKAMATLHKGFAGKAPRRFLPLKDQTCEAREIEGLPGVRIHVLGPPRDEKAMASMNPPEGGAYLRARAAAGEGEPVTSATAFSKRWQLDRTAFEVNHPRSTFSADDQQGVDMLAEEPDGDLAAAIDKAVNNTSLILMFEVGDQWLLFPGDAQWGAWNAALTVPACRELLARTTFYKVGHHGSENATPRELIETVIGQSFTAFFSTAPVKQWPNIPRAPLVTAIAGKGKYARSDDEDASVAAGFTVSRGLYTEWEIPIG
jgi:beta-lactamase superfamily II metal-dependent hydrolase